MRIQTIPFLLLLFSMPTFAITPPQAKQEFEEGAKMAKCSAFEKNFSYLPIGNALNHSKTLDMPDTEDEKAMYAIFAKHYEKGTAYNIASADAMYHALQQYDEKNLYASGLPRQDYSRDFKIGYTIANTKDQYQLLAQTYIANKFIIPNKTKKLDYATAKAYEQQLNNVLEKFGCHELV